MRKKLTLAKHEVAGHTVRMEIVSNTAAWQPSADPRVTGWTASSAAAVTKVERQPTPSARAVTEPRTAVSNR